MAANGRFGPVHDRNRNQSHWQRTRSPGCVALWKGILIEGAGWGDGMVVPQTVDSLMGLSYRRADLIAHFVD